MPKKCLFKKAGWKHYLLYIPCTRKCGLSHRANPVRISTPPTFAWALPWQPERFAKDQWHPNHVRLSILSWPGSSCMGVAKQKTHTAVKGNDLIRGSCLCWTICTCINLNLVLLCSYGFKHVLVLVLLSFKFGYLDVYTLQRDLGVKVAGTPTLTHQD